MNETQNQLKISSGSEITLWNVVRLLLGKFYWLLLCGAVLGLVVFLVTTFLITPTYESRVSFYVYNTSDSASNTGTINNNDLQAAESLATTYSKILESNSVLDAVLKDLGSNAEITRKDLGDMVEVAVISDTQLLEVVITSTDARFSCKVATAFAKTAPTEIVRITKAGGVEVVDYPEVATEKATPRTVFDTVVGFVVGLIIASVVIILKTLSDTTIYLPEDIDGMTGITVLGQIPEIEAGDSTYNYWNVVKGGVVRFEHKTQKAEINE